MEEIVDNSIIKALVKASNFRHFFDKPGFSEEVKLRLLWKLSEGNMVNYLVRQVAKGHENVILFIDVDMWVNNLNHNHPLYVESLANGYSVKQTFIANGSLLNIMPLLTLKAIKINEGCIVK